MTYSFADTLKIWEMSFLPLLQATACYDTCIFVLIYLAIVKKFDSLCFYQLLLVCSANMPTD